MKYALLSLSMGMVVVVGRGNAQRVVMSEAPAVRVAVLWDSKVDFEDLRDDPDVSFREWATQEIGVGKERIVLVGFGAEMMGASYRQRDRYYGLLWFETRFRRQSLCVLCVDGVPKYVAFVGVEPMDRGPRIEDFVRAVEGGSMELGTAKIKLNKLEGGRVYFPERLGARFAEVGRVVPENAVFLKEWMWEASE